MSLVLNNLICNQSKVKLFSDISNSVSNFFFLLVLKQNCKAENTSLPISTRIKPVVLFVSDLRLCTRALKRVSR